MNDRPAPLRIVIADDQPLVRAGLRQLMDDHEDIEVVSEARDGATAVTAVLAHRPDVVLMDLRMPGVDGIEATRSITAAGVATRVLVLTTFDDDGLVIEAIRAGASGYVLKGIEPDQLADAIRTIAQGDSLVSPAVTRAILDVVRYEVARNLLRDTRRPVSDIAPCLGYGDDTAFSRAFRRWSGMSPGQWREANAP